ncbi:fasciclin domain-containing protein [Pontibacter sp. 172403-2]|uniref:fasciclin domain-containing protein n=1 Tax=Pontibacter rufus TaxID=2791028 RepID=UPI0018AFEE6A|nr:fasciclin domain-containing protein [Pontibacter sp. 172403-2]MBF9252101.1 fasciclin domain-containing protein [Pontibacter sp. 172403-2]
MRNKITTICMAATAAVLLGCASVSDSTDVVNSSAETEATETGVAATTDSAAVDDTTTMDTNMTADNEDETVSADNPVGKARNIFALIQSNPDLSTLTKLVRAADMVTILDSPAEYTLFAPTDEAFAALPEGTVETLMLGDNKLELTRILQAHVLPNRVMSYELKDNMQMQTAQGDEVVVQVDDRGFVVGGAQIVTPDIKASNGVVHIINKVLLPPQE